MRVHVVVDFMFIYYKYKFPYVSGRLKKLTDEKGNDISMVYYCIKEIEGFMQNMKKLGANPVGTICFDSPSVRKDGDSEYKATRKSKLSDEDFAAIELIKDILGEAGYNIIQKPGYEADDLVYWVVEKNKSKFERTVVYTIDKDLLVNISYNVAVMRYKQKQGYTAVNIANVEDILEKEFGTKIPLAALQWYLASVGDKSDNIKGIKGFGNKAWESLMRELGAAGVYEYNNPEAVRGLLTETEYNEFLESLAQVKALPEVPSGIEDIRGQDIYRKNEVYRRCGFYSLVDE